MWRIPKPHVSLSASLTAAKLFKRLWCVQPFQTVCVCSFSHVVSNLTIKAVQTNTYLGSHFGHLVPPYLPHNLIFYHHFLCTTLYDVLEVVVSASFRTHSLPLFPKSKQDSNPLLMDVIKGGNKETRTHTKTNRTSDLKFPFWCQHLRGSFYLSKGARCGATCG